MAKYYPRNHIKSISKSLCDRVIISESIDRYSEGGGWGGWQMPPIGKWFCHYLKSCPVLFGIHFSVKGNKVVYNYSTSIWNKYMILTILQNAYF